MFYFLFIGGDCVNEPKLLQLTSPPQYVSQVPYNQSYNPDQHMGEMPPVQKPIMMPTAASRNLTASR